MSQLSVPRYGYTPEGFKAWDHYINHFLINNTQEPRLGRVLGTPDRGHLCPIRHVGAGVGTYTNGARLGDKLILRSVILEGVLTCEQHGLLPVQVNLPETSIVSLYLVRDNTVGKKTTPPESEEIFTNPGAPYNVSTLYCAQFFQRQNGPDCEIVDTVTITIPPGQVEQAIGLLPEEPDVFKYSTVHVPFQLSWEGVAPMEWETGNGPSSYQHLTDGSTFNLYAFVNFQLHVNTYIDCNVRVIYEDPYEIF